MTEDKELLLQVLRNQHALMDFCYLSSPDYLRQGVPASNMNHEAKNTKALLEEHNAFMAPDYLQRRAKSSA